MDSHRKNDTAQPEEDVRTVDELISAALSEPGEDSSWDAISTLQGRGSWEVFERASELCRSFCPVELQLGANVLGQLGIPDRSFSRQCVSILLGMLGTEQESDVLGSVLFALSHRKDPKAIGPAAKFRHHANPDVREGVLHAMMGHEDPLAIESLIGLSSDPEAHIRDWACFALGTQIDADTPVLRDALAARLTDDDDDARCEALVGLAQRGDQRVLSPLRKALASDSVSTLEVEAAALIANRHLLPELIALRAWWAVDVERLERAIQACSESKG